jgi:hypothetical protein
MTFVYIVVTVTVGYPFITGLSIACGLDSDHAFYASKSDRSMFVTDPEVPN